MSTCCYLAMNKQDEATGTRLTHHLKQPPHSSAPLPKKHESRVSETMDTRQQRTVIPRRETRVVRPASGTADCLEGFQTTAQGGGCGRAWQTPCMQEAKLKSPGRWRQLTSKEVRVSDRKQHDRPWTSALKYSTGNWPAHACRHCPGPCGDPSDRTRREQYLISQARLENLLIHRTLGLELRK